MLPCALFAIISTGTVHSFDRSERITAISPTLNVSGAWKELSLVTCLFCLFSLFSWAFLKVEMCLGKAASPWMWQSLWKKISEGDPVPLHYKF